jgi:hypothetical protein
MRYRRLLLNVSSPPNSWKVPSKPLKEAAILLPTCTVKSVPSVLFTLRSTSLKSHAGEVRYINWIL